MSEAVRYDRLTGYFSSTILALAARGVAGLVQNGGRMRLVSSPQFTEQDIEVLTSNPSETEIDNLISDRFRDLVSDVEGLADFIAKDHLRAFAWMLKQGYLEVRILVPRDFDGRAGIFHSKVGILTDSEGNKLSFSGSVNETAAAWKHNIEEFKVFRSWEPEGARWVKHDQAQFERYWSPSADMPYVSRPLPDKIRESLVAVAPQDFESLDLSETRSSAPGVVAPRRCGTTRLKRLRNGYLRTCEAFLKWLREQGKLELLSSASAVFRGLPKNHSLWLLLLFNILRRSGARSSLAWIPSALSIPATGSATFETPSAS